MRGGRLKQFPDPLVIPAQAGTQTMQITGVALRRHYLLRWVPACAGMTIQG